MKTLSLLLLATFLATPAFAGTKIGEVDIGSNMAMTSNYVWRGVSQSDKHAAVQGGVTITHDKGPYVGVWASSVDFDDNSQASMELDVFAGLTYTTSYGLKLDGGFLHYDYPGAMDSLEYDFNEYYVGASYKTHGLGISGKYSYSDDFFGVAVKSAHYLEGGLTYDLPYEIVAAAHYGYSDYHNATTPDNVDDFSVGLSKEVLGFGLDLSYYGTDKAGRTLNGDNADERIVLKISKNF